MRARTKYPQIENRVKKGLKVRKTNWLGEKDTDMDARRPGAAVRKLIEWRRVIGWRSVAASFGYSTRVGTDSEHYKSEASAYGVVIDTAHNPSSKNTFQKRLQICVVVVCLYCFPRRFGVVPSTNRATIFALAILTNSERPWPKFPLDLHFGNNIRDEESVRRTSQKYSFALSERKIHNKWHA